MTSIRLGLAVAAALAAGCDSGGARVETVGSWKRLPDAPIAPREMANGIWTGREALVFGGSDAPPTHPSAGGGSERPRALRDGAAYDPRTRAWRRIAPAPIGIEPLSPAAVADRSVYVAVPRNPGARNTRMDLLAYRLRADRWGRLRSPPRRGYVLVAAGDRLIAAGPDRGPVIVWHDGRLVLIGYDPAADRAGNPAWARAATLRLGDDGWRRLSDSDSVLWGHGLWAPAGRRLIGLEHGGALDPERGTWSELPNTDGLGDEFGTGVLTRTRLVGGIPGSLVLDLTRDAWIRTPRLWSDRVTRQGWTSVNTRRGLLIFGGARWNRAHRDGQLLNGAWLWTPPPAR
jgi:hypothetical protein